MEKCCGQEVQKLCQLSVFDLVYNTKKNINQEFLEMMMVTAKKTTPLLTSLVLSVGPLSKSTVTLHLVSIKLLAMLVIFCGLVYWNNSNYFPHLVAIYFYSAEAKVDAITLFNYLDFSVLYNMPLKKLKNITSLSIVFIKEQS